MLDSRDMRQEGSTRQKGRMTVWMQDTGQEVYRRVEKLDMMGTGQEGRRTGGIKDRCLKKTD